MYISSSKKITPLQSSALKWLVWAGLSAPAVLIVGVLFLYPFLTSFINSFKALNGTWTIENYQKAVDLYIGDFWYTLWVCTLSLFILLFFTVVLGGFLRLSSSWFIEFLFKIPLFVPFVVVGHAMRVFLAPHGTLNSLLMSLGIFNPDTVPSLAFTTAGLILALVWKNIGLSLLLILGAFRGIDNSYLEAAKNAGAGNLRLIKDILMPMSRGSLGVVAVLTFTSMMGSFSIPAMLGNGEGNQMLMIDLYYQLVYQQDLGVTNALGVISYLVSMGAAIYYVRRASKL